MGFDLDALTRAVHRHGRVTRVVIAEVAGSSPREIGAAMLVWGDETAPGQSGTIGGGALEHAAARAARAQRPARVLSRHALGPNLGQCCGGAVTLLSERYDAATLPRPQAGVIARPVTAPAAKAAMDPAAKAAIDPAAEAAVDPAAEAAMDPAAEAAIDPAAEAAADPAAEAAMEPAAMPLAVRRRLALARSQGLPPAPGLVDGWMIEPLHAPARAIWVWGAGHVGRALVDVLAPLPDLAITWIDTAPERFPENPPAGVRLLPAAAPAALVAHAPPQAEHLIVTYSHALDLDLCHRLLRHGFGFAGLIGSATKWARFRSRLIGLGHAPEAVARITCPIGDPALGKHPQAIALGVGAALLARDRNQAGAATGREGKDKRA